MRARRKTPRRREAPRWTAEEWAAANPLLSMRWAGCCPVCYRRLEEPVERHHRKRRRDGGDTFPNVLTLHRHCHQWVTGHPDEARERGLIVATWDDPEAVPVMFAMVPYLLDGYGFIRPARQGL